VRLPQLRMYHPVCSSLSYAEWAGNLNALVIHRPLAFLSIPSASISGTVLHLRLACTYPLGPIEPYAPLLCLSKPLTERNSSPQPGHTFLSPVKRNLFIRYLYHRARNQAGTYFVQRLIRLAESKALFRLFHEQQLLGLIAPLKLKDSQ
jgi:hypothetical protein